MKALILTLLLLSLVACGDDDDIVRRFDQEEVGAKNLFSSWARTDNQLFLDLTGGSFDTQRSIQLSSPTGEICSCSVLVRGTQQAGTLDIFSCSDPDCEVLWENGSRPYEYFKGQTTLELCEAPGVCGVFR